MEGDTGAESDLKDPHLAMAVQVFAHCIGIDTHAEKNLMHIASQSLMDLPDEWELGVPDENEKHTGIPYFFHIPTGESVWVHPNQENIIEKVKSERVRLQWEQKVKVIPQKHNMHSDVYVGESDTLNQIEESKPLETSESKIQLEISKDSEITGSATDNAVQVTKSASPSDAVVPSNTITEDISSDKGSEYKDQCHSRNELILTVHVASKATPSSSSGVARSKCVHFGALRDETRDTAVEHLKDIIRILSSTVDRFKRIPEHSLKQTDFVAHKEGQGIIIGRGHEQNQEHNDIDISNQSCISILNASGNLLQLLSYEEGLSNIPNGTGDLNSVVSNNSSGKGDLNSVLLLLLSNNQTNLAPLSVTTIKAKEICLLFLSEYVLNIISMAPVASANLIDKLFELYFSTASSKESEILNKVGERGQDMMKMKSKIDTSIMLEVTWLDLIEFCSVCSVWGVRHSLLAATIMAQHHISLTELRAVRSIFTTFDRQLDGNINAFDFQDFLENLGGTYTLKEAIMILRDIDPRETQIVDLGSFIRWWCSSSPISLSTS